MKQSEDDKSRRLLELEIGIQIRKLTDMLWHTASELTGKRLDIGNMFKELDDRLVLAEIDNVEIEFRAEKPTDLKKTPEAITPWYYLGVNSDMPYIAWFEYTTSTENANEKKVVLVFVPEGYNPDIR